MDIILLIEDDSDILDKMSERLANLSYNVIKCQTYNEAKKVISEELYDIAIIDIEIPKEDVNEIHTNVYREHLGVKLAKEIHDISPKTGIIFRSAFGDQYSRISAMINQHQGYIGYILKVDKYNEKIVDIIEIVKNGGIFVDEMLTTNEFSYAGLKFLRQVVPADCKYVVEDAYRKINGLDNVHRIIGKLISKGYTNRQIVIELTIQLSSTSKLDEHFVENKIRSIVAKLFIENQQALGKVGARNLVKFVFQLLSIETDSL